MKDRLLQLISPLVFLLIWELLVQSGTLDARFFPAPSEILVRTGELLCDGTLFKESSLTLCRMAIGFVLAAVPAVMLSVEMGVSRTTLLILAPLIASLYPVPKIALVPM